MENLKVVIVFYVDKMLLSYRNEVRKLVLFELRLDSHTERIVKGIGAGAFL